MTTDATPKDADRAALAERLRKCLPRVGESEFAYCCVVGADLRAAIALLAASAAPVEAQALDAARYRWLANRVLACDFGDNDVPGRVIGWRIRRDLPQSAFMYGPSIDAAIDQAMGAATPKEQP